MRSTKYNTRQKEEILECLKSKADGHLTADDIYRLLNDSGKNVGKTTVYRHLDKLCESGSLLKYSIGDNTPACYQLSGSGCTRHYHMVCSKCNRLFHTECHEIDDFISHFEDHHGFKVDMTKTTLYGICKQCANA